MNSLRIKKNYQQLKFYELLFDTNGLIISDNDNIHEDLAELTCEISIKQKLCEELEQSQRRLHAMRHQYEEKVVQLQDRIKATEVERDSILQNISKYETSCHVYRER